MNDISFFFIMLFGVTFGYLFPYLLEELGISKKFAYSWVSVFLLALLSFLGFIMYPFLIFGYFSLTNIESFYNMSSGVFLWLAVALLLGGAAHLVYRAYRERK
jgi:hypothetical protein